MDYKKHTVSLIFLLFFGGNTILQAQNNPDLTAEEKRFLWSNIEPFFTTPEKYKDSYTSAHSPLKFYNGDTVKTEGGWENRRKEILSRWNEMMGGWPALLKNQVLTKIDSIKKENFTQYTVEFNWLPDQTTRGYLLVPDSAKNFPAVITVFYEPETAIGLNNKEKPHRDFALQLTKRGFVTLSLGTTETTQNGTYALYYPNREHATIQPLSTLAYAAANAWYALSVEPSVDSARIGITGHSYGGKWAMFASCLFDKFAAAAWSDPGIVFDETKGSLVNYWEPWYLGYYPPPWENQWRKTGITEDARGLYPKLIRDGYDLQELHALMAPRPFLVSGGLSDRPERWKDLNHSIQVYQLLGYENRVGLTARPHHSPTTYSNEQIYMFFEYFLK